MSEFVAGGECAGIAKNKLVIARLNLPNQNLTWKGKFDLGTLTLSDLDPIVHDLGLVLDDGDISHSFDSVFTYGAFDPQTGAGWKVSRQGRKWTLVGSPSRGDPLPRGLKTLVLNEQSPRRPGVVSFVIRGADYPHPRLASMTARLGLPGPDFCFEPNLSPGSPDSTPCTPNAHATTLTCK